MSHRQKLLCICLLAIWAGSAGAVSQRVSDNASSTGTGTSTADPAALDTNTTTPQTQHPARQTYPDLWSRIRAGFRLPDKQRRRSITTAAREYARARVSLRQVGERAKPFLWYITSEVERRGMPAEFALLPVVESGFRPFAYSPGRAAGLWQFLPATGRHYGLDQDWWYDGRRDVLAATSAALEYLQYLHQRFDNDWLLALAAYNCGEGTVSRAIRINRRNGKATDFWSLKLPRETRDYVPRLLGLSRLIDNPTDYGIVLPDIPDRPQVYAVELPGQVDLALVARLADLEIEDIYRLNPGFNRWATKPEGPHYILLPVNHSIRFQARLAAIPAGDHIQWKQHTVVSGDSLKKLARRYGTTRDVLRSANGMHSNRLKRGSKIRVPIAAEQASSYTFSQSNRRNAKASSRGGTRREHIVRAGDTLWDISRLHGVSYRKLAAWNGISPSAPLRLGKTLVIWSKKPTDAGKKVASGEKHRLSYQVRKGDSLWLISRKFKVAINDLKSWNSLGHSRLLKPGQQLTVYVGDHNI